MNNYYNRYADPEYFIKKEMQRKEIKTLGLYTGFALIGQIILQNGLALIMDFAGLTDKYLSDGIFQNAADILIVLISFLLPYFLIGKSMNRVSGIKEPIMLGKPVDALSFILAIVAGIGFCMVANIVTSYFTVFLGIFGVELSSPDIAMPKGFSGVLTTVIRVVVVAAITEELTLRGYIMGNLRKYGDKFAILVSALVFAVMHGNLIQAPFALIAGFGIGYLSIKTGTIWTGIAIHFANNLISTVISYAMDILPEETVNTLYIFVLYGFIIVGFIAFLFLKPRTENMSMNKDLLITPTSEKIRVFFLNPAMITALFYMLYITMRYIGFNF